MMQWNVRFTNKPTGNTIERTVDAIRKEGAIALARDSLKCPNMWDYTGAVPVHPDEQTNATPKTETS